MRFSSISLVNPKYTGASALLLNIRPAIWRAPHKGENVQRPLEIDIEAPVPGGWN